MILFLLSLWNDEITLGANHLSFLPPASSNAVREDKVNAPITFTSGHTDSYLDRTAGSILIDVEFTFYQQDMPGAKEFCLNYGVNPTASGYIHRLGITYSKGGA